jgi:hypothetical protein
MRRVALALSLAACSTPPAPIDAARSADAPPGLDTQHAIEDGVPLIDANRSDAVVIGGNDASTDAGGASFALPPLNGGLDYQLGGAYAPPAGVTIVSRDRAAAPASGLYNICYVNGFQIQPGEEAMWMSAHPTLILRDAGGAPVIDTNWNETLIDVSTPAKRAEVLTVIGAWIDGCRASGFDAVEIDNLDSYSRSMGLLTQDDAVAMIALMADRAHADGLAIAQKNATELVPRRAEMRTDFVVAEECNHFTECDVYRGGYGEHVLMIEYDRASFTTGCSTYPQDSIVLRDMNLVPIGMSGYVYDGC